MSENIIKGHPYIKIKGNACMGCEYCISGLGENCEGPLGLDDIEASCDCPCHECVDCHNAYCVNVGGDEPCVEDKEKHEACMQTLIEDTINGL